MPQPITNTTMSLTAQPSIDPVQSDAFSRTADKLLRLSIYLLPFAGFGFLKGGLGWIQPSQFVLIILFFFLMISSSSQGAEYLGKQSRAFLICFFVAIGFSAFLSIVDNSFVSLARTIGVSISLVIFFMAYYTVSRTNDNPMKGLTYTKDFIKVSWFVAIAVLTEYAIYKATGSNYVAIARSIVASGLPYPSLGVSDLASIGRFKGILVEPGDVGYFCLPAWAYVLNRFRFRLSKRKHFIKRFVQLSFYEITGLIIFPIACILTQSFVVLLLLISMAIFTLLSKGKIKGGIFTFWIKLLFYLALIAFVSFFVFETILPYLEAGIINRFSGVNAYFQQGELTTNASVNSFLVSGTAVVKAFEYDLFLGVGPGSFSTVYDVATASIGLVDFDFNRNDGFLMLFRLLAETGIVGTFCFSSVFVSRFIESQAYTKKLEKTAAVAQTNNHKAHQLICGQGIEYAALISLIYAYLGNASYWYPIVPVLFGISFRSGLAQHLNTQRKST